MNRIRKHSERKAVVEALENRLFLTADGPQVISVFSDNRGLTQIIFNQPLMGNTVTTTSVQVFTAGNDGELNTADDVQVPATVTYGAGQDRIIVNANLPANTPYWVKLVAHTILGQNSLMIDGEFNNSTLPSGDGNPGGNFRFASNPSTGNLIARFTIDGMYINVQLAPNQSGFTQSIPNFLAYVNSGGYDDTFIHRTTTTGGDGFAVIQGGGFSISTNPMIIERPTLAPIPTEDIFDESAGTLAMANTGAPDSTSDQWFFNVTDNTSTIGDNYTVLGGVTSQGGLNDLVALNSFDNLLNLPTATDAARFGDPTVYDQLTAVPILTNANVNTVNPSKAFIFVTRVAIRNPITTLPAFGTPAIAEPSVAHAAIAAAATVQPGVFTSLTPITPSDTNSLLTGDSAKNLLD